jgi:Ca-activated chloride channel family protein
MNAVDLALVLAVDGSASVTYEEFGLIAGGMAAALREPAIVAGLTGGPAKASLCSLLLWSGAGAQEVITGWTLIASDTDARAFADQVDNMPRIVPAGQTAIGEALLASLTLLSQLPGTPARQVVDVIGDGRSNDGIAPGPVRDRMAAAGITINGLCILHEEADLLRSYQAEVIGGPGAFAVTCQDYAAFAAAMKQKLAREIAPVAERSIGVDRARPGTNEAAGRTFGWRIRRGMRS